MKWASVFFARFVCTNAIRSGSLCSKAACALILLGISSESFAISLEQVGAFVGRDMVMPPVLSPNGKHVASRVRKDGVWSVIVMKLSDRSSVLSLGMGEFTIGWIDWIDDENLILKTHRGDGFWTEWEFGRSYLTVNLKEKRPVEILDAYKGVPSQLQEAIQFGYGTARFLPGDFDDKTNDMRAVIHSGQRSIVARVNADKELFGTLAEVPGEIESEYTNHDGVTLAAFGYPPINMRSSKERQKFRERRQLWYRDKGKADWRVAHATPVDNGSIKILSAGTKKNQLFVLENLTHENTGLSTLDLKSGDLSPVFRAARTDVRDFDLDADRNLVTIRYDDHYPDWKYPNPKHPAAQLHVALRKAFPNMSIKYVSFSDDNSKTIVQVTSDQDPGTYYVVDVKSKNTQLLVKQTATTEQYVVGNRFPVEFASRDGKRISGYLTLPKGKEKKLPFVVKVRGGAFNLPGGAPAVWDFDAESQLFASAGFGVLEVNSRGTEGFGRKFAMASMGHAGDHVQNDIADGVKHIVKNGTADANRICAYGQGFGAYSAMMQVANHGDLYQCAVGMRGQYDLKRVSDRLSEPSMKARFTSVMAGRDADDDSLAAVSPAHLAEGIADPVLVVESRSRRGSEISEQARFFISAVNSADGEIDTHVETSESDEVPLNYRNERTAYKRIVEFLLANTGG
jgi:dienelactone hydrolase